MKLELNKNRVLIFFIILELKRKCWIQTQLHVW